MKHGRNRAIGTIFILLLFFGGIAPPLFGGGAREGENRLQRAEELIEEQRYNEAMVLLSEVMKREPEKFDRAEELMEKIRGARQEYNETYQELIEVLDVGPEEQLDEQRAYAIIQRLEELDADPNSASVKAFAQARRSIIFTVNNQEFERIMREARARLQEGAWEAAIELYLSGFSLHRELFVEEGYGDLQLERIEERKESIRAAVANYRELYPQLRGDTEDARIAVENSEAPREDPRFQALLERQRSILETWSRVAAEARELEALRRELLGGQESDIPYLSTLRILSRGRRGSEQADGIAGAIERALYDSFGEIRGTVRESYRALFTVGTEQYFEGEFEASRADLALALNHAAAMEALNGLWSDHLDRAAELELPARTGPDRQELRRSSLYLQAIRTAAGQYRQLPAVTRALEEARQQAEAAEELEPIREAQALLRNNQTLVAELGIAAEATREELSSRAEEALEGEPEEALQVVSRLEEELSGQLQELRSAEAELVTQMARMQYQPHRNEIDTARENVEQARSLVEGVQEQVRDEAEPIEVRYPRRGAELVGEAQELLEQARSGVEEVLASIEERSSYLLENEPVREAQRAGRQLVERVTQLSDRAGEIATRARELNRQADLAQEEGNLRLQEARVQLQRGNFERAREKLEQAGNAYSNSLGYREDPEVRQRIDQAIPELAETILFRQNQQIVREVRQLINRGRELFFQENFIEAEQVLQRAQSRWRQTHPEDDPEINIWLTRVQRALETTTGVRIATTDPLYPDMMQVLNLARNDYRDGVELYEAGDRQAALERFREAEKKIEYVKEPFPNNQAAGVLYLRILQYTSPQDFNTIFSSRFSAAREKLETVPEEAYRELQVLEEIKPDFPGMQEAIRQAEIATGIRQPPPDPEKLARARELYRQARDIVEEDVRARFPVALTYLNEALKLNPDYQDAILLKDRVQAGRGGQVRVVLSSVDQQKLRRAEDLFIESRYYEASAIVEQLYQDPENRKNPKLLELKRRIESKL